MLCGRGLIWNFHYRELFKIFQEQNLEVLESENDYDAWAEFAQEEGIFSRAVTGKGYSAKAQMGFYAALTLLQRNRWHINMLPQVISLGLQVNFNFCLDMEAQIERDLQKWLSKQPQPMEEVAN